jgi:hypothetical protein
MACQSWLGSNSSAIVPSLTAASEIHDMQRSVASAAMSFEENSA